MSQLDQSGAGLTLPSLPLEVEPPEVQAAPVDAVRARPAGECLAGARHGVEAPPCVLLVKDSSSGHACATSDRGRLRTAVFVVTPASLMGHDRSDVARKPETSFRSEASGPFHESGRQDLNLRSLGPEATSLGVKPIARRHNQSFLALELALPIPPGRMQHPQAPSRLPLGCCCALADTDGYSGSSDWTAPLRLPARGLVECSGRRRAKSRA